MLVLKKVYAVAHTHWDFEWYFSRQEARVQFIFHMDDVFKALAENKLEYYMLDGQMAIVDDYLKTCPEKRATLEKYVKAGRLFVGPWYTQIDEMVTSGESAVRNLRLGLKASRKLGKSTKVGYLPDSFGQSKDMPKIYNGFGIKDAVFWRGLPADQKVRYFYWTSEDGSKVLTANIKNGYYAGVDLVEKDNFKELMQNISTDTNVEDLVLPIGGDQRAVDFNLKKRLKLANRELAGEYEIIESNYPEYFKALEQNGVLPELSGEFIDPSVSKIHRGIYSSRYDLKQIYDELEQLMIYQVEPLSAISHQQGMEVKQGLIDEIWQIIAKGQAHDSSGGSNSDKTNRDIYNRAVEAQQLARSLKDYLLRKLSVSVKNGDDLFLWNPLPMSVDEVRELEVSTTTPSFEIISQDGKIDFDLIEQKQCNAATLRRNPAEMDNEYYYVSRIAMRVQIKATDWISFRIKEGTAGKEILAASVTNEIQNEKYQIEFENGQLNITDKLNHCTYINALSFEDGGDEGDTYDYSPAYKDWIINLGFANATITTKVGKQTQIMLLEGTWHVPYDLQERAAKKSNGAITYRIKLQLDQGGDLIKFKMNVNNQILDHRLRLVMNTGVKAQNTFADTQFGVAQRPVIDPKMDNWQAIGYREEPTALRPMLHFANVHDREKSFSFITAGMREFQAIGDQFDKLAVTLFRGVGFLGRPDLKRRPGDASGLVMKSVATPDSQLMGEQSFQGAIVITHDWDPRQLQCMHLQVSQSGLYYQRQVINRFTTPLQYFAVNELANEVKHRPIVKINNLKVTLSSFQTSVDQTGYELRLYNPTQQTVANPGNLQFTQNVNVSLMDLKGEVQQTVANAVKNYSLPKFKPGEIRTMGLFPIGEIIGGD